MTTIYPDLIVGVDGWHFLVNDLSINEMAVYVTNRSRTVFDVQGLAPFSQICRIVPEASEVMKAEHYLEVMTLLSSADSTVDQISLCTDAIVAEALENPGSDSETPKPSDNEEANDENDQLNDAFVAQDSRSADSVEKAVENIAENVDNLELDDTSAPDELALARLNR